MDTASYFQVSGNRLIDCSPSPRKTRYLRLGYFNTFFWGWMAACGAVWLFAKVLPHLPLWMLKLFVA